MSAAEGIKPYAMLSRDYVMTRDYLALFFFIQAIMREGLNTRLWLQRLMLNW